MAKKNAARPKRSPWQRFGHTPASKRRSGRNQPERGTRLGIERLEDRRLLSAGGNEQLTSLLGFESDVAVNPNDPNIVAVSQFQTALISHDGGRTFPTSVEVNAPDPYLNTKGGNPTLSFDNQGNLYFGYLSNLTHTLDVANPGFETLVNLIDNGSFESPADGASWTSNLVAPGQEFNNSWVTTDGDHYAAFGSGAVPTPPAHVLSQTFTTVPGQHYEIEFDYGAYGDPVEQSLQVTIAGGATVLDAVVSSTSNLGHTDPVWQTESFLFTASSTLSTLTFADISDPLLGASTDGVLDRVSVVKSTSGTFPTEFADWNGDLSGIVPSQDGITPVDAQMLQFVGTTLSGGPPDGTKSSVIQLVDMSSFVGLIESGGAVADLSAQFNRVAGDAETDTQFSLTLWAHQGSPAAYSRGNASLGSETASIFTDGDVNTWETASLEFAIPAGTDYVAIELTADENIQNDFNDFGLGELDGHYADNVVLEVDTNSVFAAVVDPDSGTILENTQVSSETGTVGQDKAWIAADHWSDSPFRDNAYLAWTRLDAPSEIIFSSTSDGGMTWSAPQQLDPGGQGYVWPAELTVGRNGDVWAGWHTNTHDTGGSVVLRRSSDGGATFQPLVTPFPAGTAAITDNVSPNPNMPGNISWMQGAMQPRILIDPLRTNQIYVIAVDDPDDDYAAGDPADIVMARSTDNGATWTRTTISHAPYGTIQTMPSAAIDEDGNITVTWYDSRQGNPSVGLDQIPGTDDDNLLLDVYATASLDGGVTFSHDFQINENSFDPDLGEAVDYGLNFPIESGHSILASRFWSSSEGGNDHWYYLLTGSEDITWTNARDAAEFTGGYLATTTTDLERELIADLYLDNVVATVGDGAVYLGGFQNTNSPDFSEPLGGWEWITDEAFDYNGWSPGEPGNHGAIPENFMIMDGRHGWADIPDVTYVMTYIVEFDPGYSVTSVGKYNGHDAASGYAYVSWTANDGANQDIAFDAFSALSAFPDALEENDTPANASSLGSAPYLHLDDLTIHPADSGDDDDFFRYTAHMTGTLLVHVDFVDRAGNLDLEIQDTAGNQLAISDSTDDDERVVIPVVAGQDYILHVYGADGNTNHYDLEVENFAAPVPSGLFLDPASDTGMLNSDNLTADNTPRFIIQADLTQVGSMLDTNPSPNPAGVIDSDGAAGADVQLELTGINTGTSVTGSATRIGTSHLWQFTPAAALPDDVYFVSAAVTITDLQATAVTGRTQFSAPLQITIDSSAPAAPAPDLLASSDSGVNNSDDVTNRTRPAFTGVAEINTKVFVYGQMVDPATGNTSGDVLLIGSGLVGSDATDNSLGNGTGRWEVAVEPLVDSVYNITVRFEDQAGNLSDFSSALRIVVDSEAPNTPLLDLRDDTGEDLHEEFTTDNTPDVFMTTTDPNIALAQTLFTDNLVFRVFDRFENNTEFLLYDSALDSTLPNEAFATDNSADPFTALTAITQTLPAQFFADPAPNTNSAVLAGGVLADGTHNLKLEVEDRAGNISHDFLLEVVVDTATPAAPAPDLLASSDSGVNNSDDVTNRAQPAFTGVAEINTKVFVYGQMVDPATGNTSGDVLLIGSGLVGSDATDDSLGNGTGRWEVTVEPLVDSVYDITVRFEDQAGNLSDFSSALRIVVDSEAPNTPFLDLLEDSGRSDVDNITRINAPLAGLTTTDPNIALAQTLFTDNLVFRVFDRFESGPEILIYDSTADSAAFNQIDPDTFTALTSLTKTLPFLTPASNAIVAGALADGSHNLKLEVEDRAGNISHDFLLEIIVDTMAPPVAFGLPDAQSQTDGLAAESDSGVTTTPQTAADRITSDTTPMLWGRAEADTVVAVYLDRNADGMVDLSTDTFLGQTVAVPADGNHAFFDGFWELNSTLDLNQIVGLPKDGLRELLVTAEDVAGNPLPTDDTISVNLDALDIFIDTQGPQATAVFATENPAYDLFDPKPSVNGPTPLISSLTIALQDLPDRLDQFGMQHDFLHEALQEDIAGNPGNYLLTGDHVGHIAISNIVVSNDSRLTGTPAVATVELQFAQPLPDDRFTLTVSDALVDPAGNHFDGESNSNQPLNDPSFPSGDEVPGGELVSRFTVDSRPELGSYVSTTVNIDINGNSVWDPAPDQIGGDATHLDLSFTLPVANGDGSIGLGGFNVHDLLFAGKFAPDGELIAGGSSRGFDQLASYGHSAELGGYRWIIDTNSDGVVNPAEGDIVTLQPLQTGFDVAGAIPLAGNFDGNSDNGDEVGLYNRGTWVLDSNHDFILDTTVDTVLSGNLLGHPVVGDFDGDGNDDLAVFNDNQFFFDLSGDGVSDQGFTWGFPGVLDRPVAVDMDQDGIDDVGLWVPRNGAQVPAQAAEWFFLISNDFTDARMTGTVNTLDHAFETVPFGSDLSALFGHERSLPIVGNFDPPVATVAPGPPAADFNTDQLIDAADIDALFAAIRESSTDLDYDLDGDQAVTQSDADTLISDVLATRYGDLNLDQAVDLSDYNILANNFDPHGQHAPGWAQGDLDGDRDIDLSDYTTLVSNFSPAGTSQASAADEPSQLHSFDSSEPGGTTAADNQARHQSSATEEALVDFQSNAQNAASTSTTLGAFELTDSAKKETRRVDRIFQQKFDWR